MVIIKNGDEYFNLEFFIHATVNGMGDVAIQFENGKVLVVTKSTWKKIIKKIDQTRIIDVSEDD